MDNTGAVEVYTHRVKYYESDIHALAKPSLFINLAIHAALIKSDMECMDAGELLKRHGIVWMLARLRQSQYAPVRDGDVLSVSVSARCVDAASYMREVTFTGGCGMVVCRSRMYFTGVSAERRMIVRTCELERLWPDAVMPVKLEGFRRIRVIPSGEMELCGELAARYGDCDKNGHLTSAAYADMMCEAGGFWKGIPQLMESLQIDYCREQKPGALVRVYQIRDGGGVLARGETQSGDLSFMSRYGARELNNSEIGAAQW